MALFRPLSRFYGGPWPPCPPPSSYTSGLTPFNPLGVSMLRLSFNQVITTSIRAQSYMGMEQLELKNIFSEKIWPYYIIGLFGHGTRG